jgi:citrate lyase subunit beta/citryl-CoA lyase
LVEDRALRAWALFDRINALDTGLTLDDLCAVVKPGLDALLIPKTNDAADVERIAHYLDALEAKSGMARGSVKLATMATETAKAMFALGSYAPAHPRLVVLTWGAEDLSAALGGTDNKEADGAWSFPTRSHGRNACSWPPPPRSRRSIRSMPIFAIRKV